MFLMPMVILLNCKIVSTDQYMAILDLRDWKQKKKIFKTEQETLRNAKIIKLPQC